MFVQELIGDSGWAKKAQDHPLQEPRLSKTLEQFEFDFQPSLDRRQVCELAGLSFVERAHNVIILDPPGVGKTHLTIALGVKAVEAGYSVLFLTLETLMARLRHGVHENRLERSLQQPVYPKVLIMDEIGYLPLPQLEASLFFRLVMRRYERQKSLGRPEERHGCSRRVCMIWSLCYYAWDRFPPLKVLYQNTYPSREIRDSSRRFRD